MTPSIADALPASYRRLLPPALETPLEAERHATCAECAMCAPAQAMPAANEPTGLFFSPDVKCCTYHPSLPNFSVGGILADPDPGLTEGAARIAARIAARAGVTPLGVRAPQRHRYLYRHSETLFGRAPELLCPYFERGTGACTVWPYREAVAATYYCKHDGGQEGRLLWMALLAYLRAVEEALVRWALLGLGWPADHLLWLEQDGGEPDRLEPWQLAGQPSPEAVHRRRWREWTGRESELYRRCHQRVAALDRERVPAIVGVEHDLLLASVEERYRSLRSPLTPDPLRVNPRLEVLPSGGGFVLIGYSATDPLRLRKPLLDAVHAFDGRRPNAEVLAALDAAGARLSPGLLRDLVRHRVLVAAAGPTDAELVRLGRSPAPGPAAP
ncbi:MAG TPA: hypothetical protein VMV46_06425 [Thermoanaerobaculia bacterium]|nr:hypothetical protein [Thermoanaerobaculia bacterium]